MFHKKSYGSEDIHTPYFMIWEDDADKASQIAEHVFSTADLYCKAYHKEQQKEFICVSIAPVIFEMILIDLPQHTHTATDILETPNRYFMTQIEKTRIDNLDKIFVDGGDL